MVVWDEGAEEEGMSREKERAGGKRTFRMLSIQYVTAKWEPRKWEPS